MVSLLGFRMDLFVSDRPTYLVETGADFRGGVRWGCG